MPDGKRAEEDAGELLRQIEFILGATKTGLDIIDSQLNLRYVDPEWAQIYGDWKGRKCYEYFMDRDSPCPACGIPEALRTKQVCVTQELLPKEGNRPIQVTTIPYQDKHGDWLIAEINVDITQVTELQAHLHLFKMAVEASTDAIGMAHPDGRHFYQNKAFNELFGKIGESPVNEVYVDQKVGEAVFATIMAGGEWSGAVQMRAADKTLRDIVLRAYPTKDEHGGITALVGLHLDITEQRRAQEEMLETYRKLEAANAQSEQSLRNLKQAQSQLLQSEKMASIGQLAAGVAHEINNPIGFIFSNMNTLREYISDIKQFTQQATEITSLLAAGDNAAAAGKAVFLQAWMKDADLGYILGDIDKLVAETVDGAERVRKIVLDLRTFSRADQGAKSTADINAGLQSTINLCWNELKYRCTVIKDLGDIPEIVCYPMKLNQVFMNLIVNAAQAIKDKGTVTIRTFQEGGWICVQVSDTGCGIAKENIAKVFDPFFTTKPVGKGTGLGLSIAYGIVTEHGGKIDIESEIGKGTTFTVRLPVGGLQDGS